MTSVGRLFWLVAVVAAAVGIVLGVAAQRSQLNVSSFEVVNRP